MKLTDPRLQCGKPGGRCFQKKQDLIRPGQLPFPDIAGANSGKNVHTGGEATLDNLRRDCFGLFPALAADKDNARIAHKATKSVKNSCKYLFYRMYELYNPRAYCE